jgi:hypothetical protein
MLGHLVPVDHGADRKTDLGFATQRRGKRRGDARDDFG